MRAADDRPSQRLLVIGLDGHEDSVGEAWMREGNLPALARLRERSARFLLDHGSAKRTGLAWEHFSSGLSPDDAERWSAVHFETDTYRVWHEGTGFTPFPDALSARTVAFDAPYFDLNRTGSVRGVMNWGAHDPGVAFHARPAGLADELVERFGEYPARECMYEICWPSPDRTRHLGDQLVRSAELRTEAALWLLRDRCPDWDVGIVVAGELHSAIEAFWHGIDADHPLHGMPSAPVAADRLRAVYRAADDMVARLGEAFPDATIVAFSMNGMGANGSDVASMLLLSELLHREEFGEPLLRAPREWRDAPDGLPMLPPGVDWSQAVKTHIRQYPAPIDWARRVAADVLPECAKRALRRDRPGAKPPGDDGILRLPFDWMPTEHYQPWWNRMRFFALPSFYDGRVRINLAGRERHGLVTPDQYERVRDEIEALVRSCRDERTGELVVERVEHSTCEDPLAMGPSDSDLIVVWRTASLGFEHPVHGRIGPLPYRRTGGHTGPYGMAYLAGDGIAPGDRGVASSFDIVPTLFDLLGEAVPQGVSGRSLGDVLRERGCARAG